MRTVFAVLTGWVTVGFFVALTDLALMWTFPGQYLSGRIPPVRLTALVLLTSTLYAVAGGWTAARLAPYSGWRVVIYLAAWGEIAGIASVVHSWGQMQWWYQIGWLILWIPAVFLGGYLRRRNSPV